MLRHDAQREKRYLEKRELQKEKNQVSIASWNELGWQKSET